MEAYQEIDRILCEGATEDVVKFFSQYAHEKKSEVISLNTLPGAGEVTNRFVHLRGIVQDTSTRGTEIYNASIDRPYSAVFGIENVVESGAGESLQSRESYFVVNVPGETEWYSKAKNTGYACGSPGESLVSKSDECRFYSFDPQRSVGITVKTYAGTRLDLAETYDIYGILGETYVYATDGFGVGTMDLKVEKRYVLHAIVCEKEDDCDSQDDAMAQSTESDAASLVKHLADSSLFGDTCTSEWVDACLHTPGAPSKGPLSVNLSLMQEDVGSGAEIERSLQQVARWVVRIRVNVDVLNDERTHVGLWLDENDDTVRTGMLFVHPGTVVILDLMTLDEGVLNDKGVKTLDALTRAVSEQRLPISSAHFETSRACRYHVLMVSQGKSLVPTDAVVPVDKMFSNSASLVDQGHGLEHVREYVARIDRARTPRLAPGIKELIETDFEGRRQAKDETRAPMTPERLASRLTLAKLGYVDEARWAKVSRMDDEVWRRSQRGA